MKDDDAPLIAVEVQPDPSLPAPDEPVTLHFTFTNNSATPVPCDHFDIDLRPHHDDTQPLDLCTNEQVGAAEIDQYLPYEGEDDASWEMDKETETIDGKSTNIISLTPQYDDSFKGNKKVKPTVTVTVNGNLSKDDVTTTHIMVTRYATSEDDTGISQELTVTVGTASTRFGDFTTDARGAVYDQNEPVQLDWVWEPGHYKKKKDSTGPPCYTLQLLYDQLQGTPLDVTEYNNDTDGGGSYNGPDNKGGLTLSHTTVFELLLTLWHKNGDQSTHRLTTAAIVRPTDIAVENLTVNLAAAIMGRPQILTTLGVHTATTDGLLLGTTTGTPETSSVLDITVTPPGGEPTAYQIGTTLSSTANRPSDIAGRRILLPIAQGSTVVFRWTPDENSVSSYRTLWYPFGAGNLRAGS
jgi:hypothetical protein